MVDGEYPISALRDADDQASPEIDAPAGSPAVPPSHCKRLRRRWRSGYLLRQPGRVVWERCLPRILDSLPFVAQARFSRSSRSEERQCRPLVVWGWGPQSWQAVSCRVQGMFLAELPHSDLAAWGVTQGTLHRALGSAADLCEHLAPGPLPEGDVELVCLAIARLALKFTLKRDHVDAMVEHFRDGGCLRRPGIVPVECFILRRMAQRC